MLVPYQSQSYFLSFNIPTLFILIEIVVSHTGSTKSTDVDVTVTCRYDYINFIVHSIGVSHTGSTGSTCTRSTSVGDPDKSDY